MKEKRLGICKLCQNKSILRNSHILPEFLYKPTYDDYHRAISVTSKPEEKEKYIQKGYCEYLLCDSCETQLSHYETYACKVLNSIEPFPIKPNTIVSIPNIDYKLFKLFELSILWKSSISKQEMFIKVDLGIHEEIIRKMLLKENPGKTYEYGCCLFTFDGSDSLDTIIMSPNRIRTEQQIGYLFFFFGYEWIFIVSRQSRKHPFYPAYLGEDGILKIAIREGSREELLTTLRRMLKHAGKIK